MTAPQRLPPGCSRWCIEWAARRLGTPELVDDAEELFAQRADRDGVRRARSWYRRQARACIYSVLLRRRAGRRRAEALGNGEGLLAGGGLSAVSWLDVKLGVRMLAKYPGLSLVSVIGMSVAIAIGAGGFGLINAIVFGELPLVEGERVVILRNSDLRTAGSREAHLLHDFLLWRGELESVIDVSAFRTEETAVRGPEGAPALVPVAHISASGFQVARVTPLMGRVLLEEDERLDAAPVVVISYDEWHRRFGEDTDVVGQTVRLGTTPHTVVGVMPQGFRFPVNHHYWVPLRLDPNQFEVGGGPEIEVFGRLVEGTTLERAQAELATVGERMAVAYPETHGHLRALVLPYVRAYVGIDGPERAILVRSAQLELSLLLIVVAANVALLVYARTVARMGEIAVRTALGASRRRVVSQFFAEALVLSTIAAVLGVAVATYGFGWFRELMYRNTSGGLPFWIDLGPSPPLIAYSVAMAVVAAVIAGVLPALKATGRSIRGGLQLLPTGASRLPLGRNWTGLIIIQVAIAVNVLPVSLYLLGPSITRGFAVPDYPFEEFLQASLTLDEGIVTAGATRNDAGEAGFLDGSTALLARLETEPQVSDVTFSSHFPGSGQVVAVEVEGLEGRKAVWLNRVDPGFFATLDVPIVAGRGFVDADAGAGSNAVVVDRVFAEELFGSGDVLGRHVRLWGLGGDGGDSRSNAEEWLEIVGVVPQFTVPPAFQPRAPKLYQPLAIADASGNLRLAVRVRRDTAPLEFMGRFREISEAVAPNLDIGQLTTTSAAEEARSLGLRLMALLIVAVMGSVLLLSAAGVYAMMSFIVASRRREIGIRAALGAAPQRVLAATFRRAGVQLGGGALGGLALAEALTRGMIGESLLFGGESPYLLPAVALVLTFVGLLAAVGPALRGLSVQPTEALRAE